MTYQLNWKVTGNLVALETNSDGKYQIENDLCSVE